MYMIIQLIIGTWIQTIIFPVNFHSLDVLNQLQELPTSNRLKAKQLVYHILDPMQSQEHGRDQHTYVEWMGKWIGGILIQCHFCLAVGSKRRLSELEGY